MIRTISKTEPRILGDKAFKIKQAICHDMGVQQVWVVELTVGRGTREVDGWVFIDPEYTEIRFETYSSMEPAGFLSGKYLRQSLEDSSLALLYEPPTIQNLCDLEDSIRTFLGRCRFCVRSLTDMSTGTCHQRAVSYRYKGTHIRIG